MRQQQQQQQQAGHCSNQQHPGIAGFLELEEDDPSVFSSTRSSNHHDEADLLLGLADEQQIITTSSGLLLTHRKNTTTTRTGIHQIPGTRISGGSFHRDDDEYDKSASSSPTNKSMEYDRYPSVSSSFWNDTPYYSSAGSSSLMVRTRRWMNFIRVWMVIALIIGTTVVVRTMKHEHNNSNSSKNAAVEAVVVVGKSAETTTTSMSTNTINNDSSSSTTAAVVLEQIFLIPLAPPNTSSEQPNNKNKKKRRQLKEVERPSALLLDTTKQESLPQQQEELMSVLKQEFHAWMQRHDKQYSNNEEYSRRFDIWRQNHHRINTKNDIHGPCPYTRQQRFGSNHFQDLTPQEFQLQYLTGYSGPKHDELLVSKRHHLLTMDQLKDAQPALFRHDDVLRRRQQQNGEENNSSQRRRAKPYSSSSSSKHVKRASSSLSGCSWTDVSCWLRWLARKFLYGIGGTLVPGGNYPDAIDWRDYNAVTGIHSQGNCGACWAITAVETVESAYAIKKGILLELEESEVILCDDTCEMCEGGWPQNAYEYIMENNGLPLEENWSYDGDTLLELTMIKTGESDYSESYLESYQQSICPNGSGSGSHSGDGGSNAQYDSSVARYASIKGYGYATDRCVCYNDGTGCDCDEQNEYLALRNLATYGPATVCLEASTWQDYAGGIMTTAIGCSAAFLDMNHCVQAVGYAFIDLDEMQADEGEEQQQQQQGSGSNSKSGSQASRDDGNRQGYWIVRNQWSENWGINGYAYIAMGDNTCGILNDMTQAYM